MTKEAWYEEPQIATRTQSRRGRHDRRDDVRNGSCARGRARERVPGRLRLLSVSVLTSEGYNVPALVDSPTSGVLSYGKPGNGDGWVCGVQLGNRTTHFGLPFYNFIDDTLRRHASCQLKVNGGARCPRPCPRSVPRIGEGPPWPRQASPSRLSDADGWMRSNSGDRERRECRARSRRKRDPVASSCYMKVTPTARWKRARSRHRQAWLDLRR